MRLLLFSISLALSLNVLGQLLIDDSESLSSLAYDLEMEGMVISNVSVNMPFDGNSLDNPAGRYNDQIGLLGLDEGIIFTTGAAINALGPNDSHNATQENNGSGNIPFSQELTHLIDEVSTYSGDYEITEETIEDYVILEFDFVTVHDRIKYNYVFGSEEYPFPNAISKSDCFGFYISGPGITGLTNIARAGGAPISARSVNHHTNEEYYVSNGTGDTPFIDFYHQYDGSTTVLEAAIDVIPCQSYHVKMILFDADWKECDSGVFIEPGTLDETSGPLLEVVYEAESIDHAIEGCSNGSFVLHRSESDKTIFWDEDVTYDLIQSGTATSGVDYSPFALSVTIPAFADSILIPVSALEDSEVEGIETITLEVVSTCVTDAILTSATMEIDDEFEYDIPDVTVCFGDSVELNSGADETEISVVWQNVDYLTCTTCLKPLAFPKNDTTLVAEITHLETGCTFTDSVNIEVVKTVASFAYFTKDNYTTLDAFFENTSLESDKWYWTYGDGADSDEEHPDHTYQIINHEEPQSFSIRLVSEYSVLGCSDTADTIITIGEPLFIPNVFTPNDDDANETFIVKGIQPGIWILDVFNRWGDQVYKSEGYSNDWDGDGVSDGVYYIELRNPPGDRSFKEWVFIER